MRSLVRACCGVALFLGLGVGQGLVALPQSGKASPQPVVQVHPRDNMLVAATNVRADPE